jgi:hypothetical protein
MKFYFAGERWGFKPYDEKVNAGKHISRRLISYHYHGAKSGMPTPAVMKECQDFKWPVFLDSGAFSAWSQGAEINVDKYAKFINEHGHNFFLISALDDTFKNVKRNRELLLELERQGCKVCPVHHAREPDAQLTWMLDRGYPYIFLGGMVPETTPALKLWLDHLWANYLTNPDGTARVHVHGFGLTDLKMCRRYPWESVDSSSWIMTGNFGGCNFWHPTTGRAIKVVFSQESPETKKLEGTHYDRLPLASQRQVDAWLAQLGVTAAQCASHYSYRDIVNAAFYAGLDERGTTTFHRDEVDLWTAS